MRKFCSILLMCLSITVVNAQKYVSKNAHVKFFSETPMENIEANNNQVNCALDASNGNLVFKILIKSFEFEKALMQEHFNENYMESDRIPVSTFSGKVEDFSKIDFNSDGTHEVMVSGMLSIHGIKKEVQQKGQLVVEGNNVKCKSVFFVKPADYEIKIGKSVTDKIAEKIEVTVNATLKKM